MLIPNGCVRNPMHADKNMRNTEPTRGTAVGTSHRHPRPRRTTRVGHSLLAPSLRPAVLRTVLVLDIVMSGTSGNNYYT